MKIASDVEAALDRLPQSLSELYALVLAQIQQTEPEGRLIAENTLKWLLCAQIALSTEQVIHLVSPASNLLFSVTVTAADILSLCCNFVVVDLELNCFRFAHLSVRDFLESRRVFSDDTTHAMAVSKCLDIYDIDPVSRDQTIWSRFQAQPSYEYAARYWIVHYKEIDIRNRTPSLRERTENFFVCGFDCSPCFPPWISYLRQTASVLDPYDSLTDNFISCTSAPTSPLFSACAFSLLEVLRRLEDVKDFDWHQKTELSATGIHIAARHGYPDIVEYLLRKGVDINAKTSSGATALLLAAQYGHVTTVNLLLSNRAGVEGKDDEGWTALDMAIGRKEEAIISLLLRNGAKAEALTKYGENIASWQDQRSNGTLRLRDLLGRPTGYVGILNEGQTGYLNTVLQLFYMLRPIHQVSVFNSGSITF